MNALEHLVAYTQWANRRWLDYIAKNHSGDEYLLKMIAHIAQGERAWFQRLFGAPLDRQVWKPLTLPDTRAEFARNAQSYSELLRGDLDRRIDYVRNSGETGSARVEDILLHLSTNGCHHRAMMKAHLEKKGVEAPSADFIEYTRVYGPGEIPRE